MNSLTLTRADDLAEMLCIIEPKIVIPAQKPVSSVPNPLERPSNWIKYEDDVLFIIDDDGYLRIRTGHICSWPGSHGVGLEVNNIKETIVWCDQVLNEDSDNADDAHERCFDPKDPCLIRMDEIEPFEDCRFAAKWFQGIYPARAAVRITRLLSRPDFGILGEEKAKSARWKKFHKMDEANMLWWQQHGCPHPDVAKAIRKRAAAIRAARVAQ